MWFQAEMPVKQSASIYTLKQMILPESALHKLFILIALDSRVHKLCVTVFCSSYFTNFFNGIQDFLFYS